MEVKKATIAIVGGGVAGASIALYLGELGLDVTLFEKGKSLVNGPPICHLHAGGNLYREIDNDQCVTLLKQSIDLLKFLPFAIDYRPTVIAIPKDDKGNPEDLCDRLQLLKSQYASLIKEDISNKVLGKVDEYFKVFNHDEIEILKKKQPSKHPKSLDEWMIPVAKNLDLEKIKFPLVMVQEYGLNIFRIASTLTLALEKIDNATILKNTKVINISQNKNSWNIHYKKDDVLQEKKFDFVINAAGFRSGELDDMLEFKRDRLVEFKAAYVTKWASCDTIWPEVIFHGERSTPQGMAQFTPYPNGYFQLHGMTKDITLFDNGLVKNTKEGSQPQLNKSFLDKIDKGWEYEEVKKRTELAILHVANFIPEFSEGKVSDKPLYGAQQIPGNDASLRATDISFEKESYARCEIVKASSVLSMADDISAQLIKLGLLDASKHKSRDFKHMQTIPESDIFKYAQSLCVERDYPIDLAGINTSIKI